MGIVINLEKEIAENQKFLAISKEETKRQVEFAKNDGTLNNEVEVVDCFSALLNLVAKNHEGIYNTLVHVNNEEIRIDLFIIDKNSVDMVVSTPGGKLKSHKICDLKTAEYILMMYDHKDILNII